MKKLQPRLQKGKVREFSTTHKRVNKPQQQQEQKGGRMKNVCYRH
jgi:hypothetical protein